MGTSINILTGTRITLHVSNLAAFVRS